MHHWNIQVKVPLDVVSKNTSIRVNNPFVYDLLRNDGAGAISENNKIENGKSCLFIMGEVVKVKAVFEYIGKKKCWVLRSSDQSKLSYVSVQTFFYSGCHLTASPIQAIPGQPPFTHLPISRIVLRSLNRQHFNNQWQLRGQITVITGLQILMEVTGAMDGNRYDSDSTLFIVQERPGKSADKAAKFQPSELNLLIEKIQDQYAVVNF
ncbi:hypothetical protein BKA69DRAFT_1128341 [Paraphysoderma sedebokerense]|nr:hypothetical protein BKA69DRAFT_1128341 [Paraphysoderma sedebokerense]